MLSLEDSSVGLSSQQLSGSFFALKVWWSLIVVVVARVALSRPHLLLGGSTVGLAINSLVRLAFGLLSVP